MKHHRLPIAKRAARALPILTASILTLAPPYVQAAEEVWNNFAGTNLWSVGTNWLDTTAPLGLDPTLDLTFAGDTAYTATNDIANLQLNSLLLNSTAAVTLTGNPLDFLTDNTVTPSILQSGIGTALINNNVVTTNALTLGGTGTGVVTVSGLISGGGGLNFTGGNWLLTNAGNTYTGGTTIGLGSFVELATAGSAPQNVVITPAATSLLGSNAAANLLTLDGGTLKLTTKGNGNINLGGGRALRFGSNGGTLDLTNLNAPGVQGGNIAGGDLNITLNNSAANVAVVKFNGGQLGLSTNNPNDGNWVLGTNALRISGLAGTGPIRIEITNGALVRGSVATGGVDNTHAMPITYRGVIGGDPTSGPTGAVNTGVSLTTGRVQFDSNRVNYNGGLTIEGAVQFNNANRATALTGNIVVAGNGYAAFQGRGTGTNLTSVIQAPGGATNPGHNVMWIGENASTTLTVQGGGIAVFDGRLRSEQNNAHGVLLAGNAVLNAGGTLRLQQSMSNFSNFTGLNTNQNSGDIILRGSLTGQGTTTTESVLNITLPTPDVNGTIANGVPTPLTTAAPGAGTRPFAGLVAEAGHNLIVNGTGFGGLRVLASPRADRLFSDTQFPGGNPVPDPTPGATKLSGYLTAGRLAALTGSGGFLTPGAVGETWTLPAGGEWNSAVSVGLRVADTNALGTDLLMEPTGWSHAIAVDASATLDTGANPFAMNGGTLQGKGTVVSLGGLTIAAPATVAPGLADLGTLTVGDITINGSLQIETSSSPANDLLTIGGNLILGATSKLDLPLTNTFTNNSASDYIIATYSGTLTGTFGTVMNLPLGYSVIYGAGANGDIRLRFASVTTKKWNGNLNGIWDTGTTANWQGGATFANGDAVILDDTAAGPNRILTVTGGNVAPGAITVDTATSYTLTSTAGNAIVGTGALTKTGAGTLTMSGPNTYSGGTQINAGQLILGSNDALPDTGPITVAAAATLETQTFSDTVGDLTVNGSAVGSGTLSVGSLTLGSGATFAPNLVLQGPLSKTGAAPTTMAGSINLGADTRTINVDTGTAPELTFGGVVSNGGLTKAGPGTLVLNNAGNTYAGGTTVNGGILRIGIVGALPASSALVINGGTLDGNNTAVGLASLAGTGGTLALGTGSLSVAQDVNTTFSGAITGFASVTKTGLGVLTLNGAGNNYTGGLFVNEGTVIAASVSAPGTGLTTVNPNATFQVGASLTNPITLLGGTLASQGSPATVTSNDLTAAPATTSTILLANSTNLAANSEVILLGTLRGSGNLIVQAGNNVPAPDGGPGFRLRGTGISDFSGSVTVLNSGKFELQVNNGLSANPLGTGRIALTGGQSFGGLQGTYSQFQPRIVTAGETFNFGNNVELVGPGYVNFNILGGANVTAIFGNLRFGADQVLGINKNDIANRTYVFNSVTLTGGNPEIRIFEPGFSNSATPGGANLTLGPIAETAPSGLVLNGQAPYVTTFSGANTYTGATLINSGSVRLAAAGALPATTTLTLTGGSLDLNGGPESFSQTVTALEGTGGTITNTDLGNRRTLTINQTANTLFAGEITGNLELVKAGSGSLVLSGLQSYAALTTTGGTTTLETPLGTGAATVTANAATIFNSSQAFAALAIGAGAQTTLSQHLPPGPSGLKAIDTGALTIAATGRLDLTNNALVVRGGSEAAVDALITTGLYGGPNGYWDGPGVQSSGAAADANFLTGLGVVDNALAGYTDFAGVTGLTGPEILVKYTYYGDSDLNGVVNSVDYSLIDTGFGGGLTGWVGGDYDYNDVINSVDYSLIDAAFGGQTGPLAAFGGDGVGINLGGDGAGLDFGGADGGASLAGGGVQAVPEPGTAGLLFAGLLSLLARRRRS